MAFITQKIMKAILMLVILLLCAGILVIILVGIQQFKISSQLASINQVSNLSHLLVRQQANLYSMLLANDDTKLEQLTENLDNFTQEDFVLDASLYNNNGELLAQSHNTLDIRYQLGLDASEQQNTQQIVETIYSPSGVVGFLRVTFDSQYGQTTQHKINQLFHQLYGEMIVVFLVGVLFASSLHYFLSHYRRVKRSDLTVTPNKTPKISKQKPSLQFHRKRRKLHK
ncbi:YtjB family periplasmic protein [Conservatibacter flavescens]|uniref:Hemolysin regulation protein AhpA n=1 Tax=Conservatibacter flavescens TaxID=28161 RepID=A0A2M8S3B7_9PAST|nr:YtjB family periplasmic protein [Conservatibacter flavescens]PJG85652.1 hemolysin regulation protein AhpA [Conservatibacter flavescens]